MAALSIGTVTTLTVTARTVTLLEAVTAFQPLYENTTTNTHGKAEANDTAKDKVSGITGAPGASGGQALILSDGDRVNLGAILTKGVTYYMGRTGGTLVPFVDLATPDAIVACIYAETTSIAVVNIVNPSTDIIL